jgi:GNAT superfamily N-acetyltransferase
MWWLRQAGRVLEVPPDAVSAWFTPERPGPLIHRHVVHTGVGRCRVDRWPRPRVVLAEVAGNYALRGDPAALAPAELHDVRGFVEAEPHWLPVLQAAAGVVATWPRIIAVLPAGVPIETPTPDAVRRIGPADAAALAAHDPDGSWISNTWGGPDRLAAAAVGHGAFLDGRLFSIAVPFFVGTRHADIGVVTEAAHRGRGWSTACAAAVAADIRARGLLPTWTTSPDNLPSLGVAARLGFVPHREDLLYAVRVPIPG